MFDRERNRERTQKSILDGFGGDTYKRREVSPGVYQCGCHWIDARDDPKAWEMGVRGDILKLCVFHKQCAEANHE